MPTQQAEFNRALQGLRGVAALLVGVHSLGLWIEQPVSHNGYFFVDLFFVLSGFVIATAYADRIGSARELASFLVRRIGRLLPLLLLASALFVAAKNAIPAGKQLLLANGMGAALLHPHALAYEWPTWWEALTTVTMTQSLGTHHRLVLNIASWSISTEFWAYVVFGLAVLVVPKALRVRAFIALGAIALAVTAWAGITVHHCLWTEGCLHLTYDFGLARCLFSFFIGALIPSVKNALREVEAPVQLGAPLAIVILLWGVDRSPALAFALPFVFAMLIWSLARDTGPLARLLRAPAIVELGARSYSLYLLHPVLTVLVYAQVHRLHGPWWPALVAAVYFPVLYALAGWTYRHVEQPARRRFNAWAQRIDGGEPAAALGQQANLQA